MVNGTQATPERGTRQELVGVVTSAKMEKTIVVKVRRTTQHPLYQRVIRSAKRRSATPSESFPPARFRN
jgi:ribosomal protein S17